MKPLSRRDDDRIKKNNGNGYVWHTTGTGKTFTSFQASTLLKDNALRSRSPRLALLREGGAQ